LYLIAAYEPYRCTPNYEHIWNTVVTSESS